MDENSLGYIILFVVLFLGWFIRLCMKANVVDWGHGWINLLDGFLRLFIRTFHRFKYQPIPLPEQGGALVVSNHLSGLDPLLMMAACRRPIRFIIAREQYERFGLNWVFRQVGCIPVERGGRADKALRAALQALAQGEVVGLFPEGAIHTHRKPAKRLKGGVALLSKMSGCPVYPVTIDGILIEGFTVLTLFVPNRARLTSHGRIDCQTLDHDKCMAKLTELLLTRKN
jgi:1-acyl-sn-glycerol-3-phosphate acyltransferase